MPNWSLSITSNLENLLFDYKPKYVKSIIPTSQNKKDSSNNSDNEEYSFDETQFLNVDENPSRNVSTGMKDIKTFQPSASLKSSIYSPNIAHPSHPSYSISHSGIKDESSSKKESSRSKSKRKAAVYPKKNLFRVVNPKKEPQLKINAGSDYKRSTFAHDVYDNVVQESFDRDSSHVSMADDLDEGYADHQAIPYPEHTPDLAPSKSNEKPRTTPSKQKLSSHIQQKLDVPSYQTQDLRMQGRNVQKLLATTQAKKSYKHNRHHKSTSSLGLAQSFNERMKHFEQIKREHVLQRKEESYK